ncbi:MAG: SMC family ATPase, partial [Bdellovibrionales bacterium]|nr:SMC family ATPase [Bdellovibrionales bacterium]
MKISSIRINNITSFVNEHFINFNELIGDDSLFAITGPTGSGKSSIITAISLALYGKGHKKNLNSSDYVSQGSTSGSIRLDFQINGKEYTATWRCKVRKKDGSLIKTPVPKRELFTGNVAIDSTTEQILGLSYDHFCKTTILNQGEFAKFITSSFKDRKDILESMHDNIYLSSISTDLNKQIRALKDKIKYLSDLEKNSHPYSAEEKININEKVKSSQQKILTATPLFEIINRIHLITDDITKIQSQFTTNEKKINTLTNEASTIREQFNKSSTNLNSKTQELTLFNSTFSKKIKSLNKAIKDHEMVNLKSEKLNEHRKLLEKTSRHISDSKNLADNASDKLKQVNEELNHNLSKLTISKNNISKLQLINEHINSIDTLSSNVKIHSKTIRELEIEISNNLSEVEKNKTLIVKIKNDYNQILQTYEMNSLADDFDKASNELDILKKTTQEREREIRDAKINLNRSQSQLETFKDQVNKLTTKYAEVKHNLKCIQKNIYDLTTKKHNLTLKLSEQNREHSISTLSSEGITKQECPVCLQKWPENIVQTKYHHVDDDAHKEIEQINISIKSSEDKALITNQELKQ